MYKANVFIPVLLAAILPACTLGPNYNGAPDAAIPAVEGRIFARADTDATNTSAPVSRWWEALGDPVLDRLIGLALQANPDIDVARARLRQGRAALGLEKANALPKVGGSALYAHARLPSTGSLTQGSSDNSGSDEATNLNLYSAGLDASWEIDIFGGRRRTVESARATAEVSEANLADVQVSLAAEVADAYISLRDRQNRVALGDRSLTLQQKIQALTRQRYERGTASQLDVIRLDNQLEQTRADLLPLQGQLETYLNQLATLTGAVPGALDAMLAPDGKALPLPPSSVALGDPTDLLRRRPDIRAAERTLAADTAKIGQAEAARYPSLKILGILGVGGTQPSDLTHLDDFTAIAAPMLSWNFLDFGRAKSRVVQATAVWEEAEAQYKKAVLYALRDAEDSLSRFRHARITLATLARTKATSDKAVVLASQRFDAGTTTLLDVLDTTRQQMGAAQSVSEGQANLLRSYIAIQKALGLGWSTANAVDILDGRS